MNPVLLAVLFATVLTPGCGGPEGDLATVEVSLAKAPADVACVQLTASGGTRALSFRFGYTAGTPTVLSLAGLPAGEVVFSADCFADDCSQLAPSTQRSWFAVPVSAQVPAGGSILLTLTFYR